MTEEVATPGHCPQKKSQTEIIFGARQFEPPHSITSSARE